MPQAPKPVVRKFADGGMVRGGVMSDEDYAKRMEQGEKNMERLRSAADSIKSFLSPKEKASADNLTGDTGMSETDKAKKAAMSGGAQMPAAAEEPRRQISDYMVKPTETESKTEIQATPVETGAAPAPAKSVKAAKASVASVSTSAPAKPTETSAQMREKQLRASGGSRGARMGEVSKPTASSVSSAKASPSEIKVSGRVPTSEEAAANRQALASKAKEFGVGVANYIKNFETPAERRSRERQEGK